MRLRTRVQAPERFEDEDYDTSAANNASKPAFPRLLKEQVVAFDPHLPPAAFPSLTQAQQQAEDRHLMSDDLAEPADVDMMDLHRHLDHTFFPVVQRGGHLDTQVAAAPSSTEIRDPPVFETSFLDDVETSDEEADEIQLGRAERRVAVGPQNIHWTQLAPSLQVEIFENLCNSAYGYATSKILGLSRDEVHHVMENTWTRNKQIVAEDKGIRQLQQAQLNAILRKDHAVRLTSDSWRDHVAITRRHLPYICTHFDYLICNTAEAELARRFLNERGIDTCVLGDWGRIKKDYGGTDSTQTQAVQASESREGIDLGYTSEVAEQDTRHFRETVGEIPLRNALSEISNIAPKCLNAPSSLRRKRLQSMPGARQETAFARYRRGGPAVGIAKVPASARLQTSSSTLGLRARGSHLTQNYEEAMALMKTRGGGFDDSDVSYEDEHERLELKSPPGLKINPPKPPRGGGDADISSSAPSPGKRAIILKVSPKNLQKLQMTGYLNARSSIIGIPEVLTPPTMASIPQSVKRTPKNAGSRFHPHMPAAQVSMRGQDQHKSIDFSWKLLERQRGAAALSTPPTLSEPPSKLRDRQASTSSKRLKPNPPQDKIFAQANYGTQMSTPYGSSQLQRKTSTSSQEAPPWSPITQYSDSFSRPSSRKGYYQDKSQLNELLSAHSSDPTFHLSAALENEVLVTTASASQTIQHANTLYSKPSIAENGSPVIAFASDDLVSSAHFLLKSSKHEAGPPGSLHLFEPWQIPRPLQSNPETPSRGSKIGALLNYGSGLFGDPPGRSKSSPSRRLAKSVAEAAAMTPPSVKRSGNPPPNISPAENSKIEELFSSYKRKPQTTKKELHVQLPTLISRTSRPNLKKQSTTVPDESPTGVQASLAKNAGEALSAAALALQVSTPKKISNNGRVRPQTYVKSEKQIEKEAAARDAAKAGLGKSGAIGKARTTEVQKTNANRSMPTQTTNQDSPTSETAADVKVPLKKAKNSVKSRPVVEHQEVSHVPNSGMSNYVGGVSLAEGSTPELPEVVTSPKLKPSGSGDSKARKVSKVDIDDESYEEDEASDTSTLFKKSTIPKGKNVAISPAKGPLQGYQTMMAMRGKIGKSALTDMAPKKLTDSKSKTVGDNEEPVSRKETIPEPNGAAAKTGKPAPAEKTAAKAGGVESQETLSLSKLNLNVKDGSGYEEPSTPVKRMEKPNAGLTKELSVLTEEGEGKTKLFRGNQYLNADKTRRLNADGTPVTRKPRATPAA